MTSSDDGSAKVWDLTGLMAGSRKLALENWTFRFPPEYYPMAMSRQGRWLAFGGFEAQTDRIRVIILDLETLGETGLPFSSIQGDIPGFLAFSPDGARLVAGNGLYPRLPGMFLGVVLWQWTGSEWREERLSHPEEVVGAAFLPDRTGLATLTSDGMVRVWNLEDLTLMREAPAGEGPMTAVGISPDGQYVLVCRDELGFRLIPLADPDGEFGVEQCSDIFAFSPDGLRLASAARDQSARVWNLTTREKAFPPRKHGGALSWVEWSPDGRHLVTSGLADVAKLWDASTGALIEDRLGVRGGRPVLVARFSPDGRFLVTRSDDHLARVWDVASGEPVTPVRRLRNDVRLAMLTPDNRFLTVSDRDEVQTTVLRETSLPASVLVDYARLLAGLRLDQGGSLRSIPIPELAALAGQLRTQQPALFQESPDARRDWHRTQLKELTSLARVRANRFHLDRLAALGESGPELDALRTRTLSRGIPPRDSLTPPHLIDLGDFYTHSFGLLPRGEYSDLPTGVQILNGVSFDIRGIIRLQPPDYESFSEWMGNFQLPALRGIPVGQRCRALHFLHSVDGMSGKPGDESARWILHFADGTTETWRLIYGKELREWYLKDGTPWEITRGQIAWKGNEAGAQARGARHTCLYQATWENPRPEVPIIRLDFELGTSRPMPFVVAITADPVEK